MTGSSGPNLSRSESDPFLHLHKMSTTAGLGSGDYVAINAAAVVALLLGAASATVLLNNLFFLIFPLAGVVLSILAWIQISNSNGTQTGREVAAIALLLSLGFGGFAGRAPLYNSIRNQSDEDQIVAQLHKLGDDLKAQDYADAYSLFDSQFHKRVSRAEFEGKWRTLSNSPYTGNVQSIDWNHLLSFEIDPVDESRLASGLMLLKLKPPDPARISMVLRYEEGAWLLDQLDQVFPRLEPQTKQQTSQRPQTPTSPYLGPPKPDSTPKSP